jgi:hypothetical protein
LSGYGQFTARDKEEAMLTRIVRFRRLAAASLCALVLAVAASSRSAKAFNPQPDPPRIGMDGIANGQTARLNLANVSAPDDVLIPPPCGGPEHRQLEPTVGLAARNRSTQGGSIGLQNLTTLSNPGRATTGTYQLCIGAA